ncbi:MAG: hypothetical protein M1820_009783 [Bogoriella megaspora]|nr:MAG: hypothetical protein M1820_009783 [Bogoriella megaspora]
MQHMGTAQSRKRKKERVHFGYGGCFVAGYPSSGGLFTKSDIDIVDALFLGINRLQPSPSSSDPAEEDDDDNFLIGNGNFTKEQEAITIFGWPQKGGVLVPRYENESALLRAFDRIRMAINMQERCEVMGEYDARFYADPKEVKELAGISGLKVAENTEMEKTTTLA